MATKNKTALIIIIAVVAAVCGATLVAALVTSGANSPQSGIEATGSVASTQ